LNALDHLLAAWIHHQIFISPMDNRGKLDFLDALDLLDKLDKIYRFCEVQLVQYVQIVQFFLKLDGEFRAVSNIAY